MKSFFYGLFGCLTAFVIYQFVQSQYSDYRAKADAEHMVVKLEAVQRLMEEAYQRNSTFEANLGSKNANENDAFKPVVFPNGTIVARGQIDGQVLVLIPTVKGKNIEWSCYAASLKASPHNCRAQ